MRERNRVLFSRDSVSLPLQRIPAAEFRWRLFTRKRFDVEHESISL